MSDEPIVISVTDGVSPNVATSLRKIATEALAAHKNVDLLQNALNSMKVGSTASLSSAVSSTNNLTNAQVKSQLQADRLAASTNRLEATQKRNTVASQQLEAATSRAAIAALRLEQAQNKVNNSTLNSGRGLQNVLALGAGLVGIGFSADALIHTADAYTILQNKLQNVADSQQQVDALTKSLTELAIQTRSPLDATVTSFARFDNALKGLGASQEQTIRLQKTVNELLYLGGATTAEQASALIQLSQAFNSGKLAGDEFRSVSENMPKNVRVAIAEVLKINESGLKKAASDGKITSDVLLKAFSSLDAYADSKFAKTLPTLTSALEVFKTRITVAFGEFNKSTGLSLALANGIIFLSEHLDILGVALAGIAAIIVVSLLPAIGAGTGAIAAFTLALAANPLGLFIIGLSVGVASIMAFGDKLEIVKTKLQADDIGKAATGLRGFTDESKKAGDGLDRIVIGIANIDTTQIDAAGTSMLAFQNKIEDTNAVTVTLKDYFKGTFVTIGDYMVKAGNFLVTEWTNIVNRLNSVSLTFNTDSFLGRLGNAVIKSGKQISTAITLANLPMSVLAEKFKSDVSDAARVSAVSRAKLDLSAVTDPLSLRGNGANTLGTASDSKKDKAAERAAKKAADELANLEKLNKALGLEKDRQFDLADARSLQAKQDEIEVKYGNLKGVIAEKAIATAHRLTSEIFSNQKAQQAMDTAMAGSNQELKIQHDAFIKGIDLAKQKGLTTNESILLLNKEAAAYEASKDPIQAYIKTLSVALGAAQQYGEQGSIVNDVNAEFIKMGAMLDGQLNPAFKKQYDLAIKNKTVLADQLRVKSEQNRILSETVDIYKQLESRQTALNSLKENPNISEGYKQREQAKLNIDSANARLNSNTYTADGDAGWNDPQRNMDILTAGAGKLLEGYKGVAAGISEAFGQTFQTLEDGFASSIGNAIVKGDDLRESLRNIAISIETQLITSLVKLGIQWLVNAALGTATSTASSAALIADGIAVAAAWAPAEAAVSLASFGANSIPAIAGISSTHALSEGLAIMGMAHDGISNVPREGTWLLDKGERVVDQRTNGDLKNFLANNSRGNTTNVTNNNNTQPTTSQATNVHVYLTGLDDAITDWHNDSASDIVVTKKIERNASTISRVVANG